MAWVYILRLSNNKYYIGSTTNLSQRIKDHNNGKSNYTSKFLPLTLQFSKEYATISEANLAEKYLKRQKSRIILEQVISTQTLDINV